MNEKEVIKKLEQHGWKILRSHGSHYRLGKEALRTAVPVHGHKDLGGGLLTAIERQT